MDVTPDDRDLDDGGLELTPRDLERATRRRGSRRWIALGVLVVLVAAIGFVAWQARGATLYYRNADEAVAQRKELGTKRFRLQGVVVGEPQLATGDQPTRFVVAYNGVSVKVRHTGSEPALFKPGLPVVVEGHWNAAGTEFDSTRLLVRHTENYKAKDTDGSYEKEHPDRTVPKDDAS
ncbi:MAG: cytochrome c maturation protein CcmE [Acidimicrobiales bacterium]|nr:cytochrome c maturation protein CcmE [Acidimicrobiales bacterium]